MPENKKPDENNDNPEFDPSSNERFFPNEFIDNFTRKIIEQFGNPSGEPGKTSVEELGQQMLEDMQRWQGNPTGPDAKSFNLLAQFAAAGRHKLLLDDDVNALCARLKDPDFKIRGQAIVRLNDIGDSRAVQPLIEVLNDPVDSIRHQAAAVLAKLGDPRAIEPIIRSLEANPDYNFTMSLKLFGDEAVKPLVKALESQNARVRWLVVNLLGDIRDDRAIPALEKATTDSAVDSVYGAVRDAAAKALRAIESRQQKISRYEPENPGDFNWQELMKKWSLALLASNELDPEPTGEQIEAGWLGLSGASEAEILEMEKRLGTPLPPSYRDFLKVSNGWGYLDSFIYQLYSAREVDWFIKLNREWVDIWNQEPMPVSDEEYFTYGDNQGPERVEYLKTALQISAEGDSAVMLLNPQVVFPDGEWEAWFFANWIPGAQRYRSFREMMQDHYNSFLRLAGLE